MVVKDLADNPESVTMDQNMRDALVAVAKKGETITYMALGKRLGIWHRGHKIGQMLGQISEYEVANGRPPLSSIVVLEETVGDSLCPDGHPADGFLGCSFVPRGLLTRDDAKKYMRSKQIETWDWWKTH